jgi:hypothetical protein
LLKLFVVGFKNEFEGTLARSRKHKFSSVNVSNEEGRPGVEKSIFAFLFKCFYSLPVRHYLSLL